MQQTGGRSRAKYVVVTQGKEGCTVLQRSEKPLICPTEPVELCDPTGAGDTFIAALAVALSCGRSIDKACFVANHGARLSVMSSGASAPTFEQLSKTM